MTFEESVRVHSVAVLDLFDTGKIDFKQRDSEILELGKAMQWIRVCNGNPYPTANLGVYDSLSLLREESHNK